MDRSSGMEPASERDHGVGQPATDAAGPLAGTPEDWLERSVEYEGTGARRRTYECGDPMDGPELEIRTSTESGMHRVVSIGPASADDEAELSALSQADVALIRSTVMALLDLAGHESGPARTCVVMTPDGPRVRRCVMFRPTRQ